MEFVMNLLDLLTACNNNLIIPFYRSCIMESLPHKQIQKKRQHSPNS